MDTNYVVTYAVTVRKRVRPALAVSLQVFSLVLLNAISRRMADVCSGMTRPMCLVLRYLCSIELD